MSGALYVVATPIGNLADTTTRMRETLELADLVLVEDTRRSGRLLQQFGLKKPLFALHEHNEVDVTPALIEKLKAGDRLALISDAGTPAVSDPGFKLIRAAARAGIAISPIPGASAVITALSAAGLPTNRFSFEGFLPAKSAGRLQSLQALAGESRTMVFYESVHRIEAFVADCESVFSAQREACIARELTKMHEQIVRGTLAELRRQLATGEVPLKGEFVVIVHGAEVVEEDAMVEGLIALNAMQREGVPLKVAAKVAAKLSGASKNQLYQAGLDQQSGE